MDNPVTPENQNFLIEDALQTFPRAAMPRDITADVMARIRTSPTPRPFRLSWSDVVLGIVFSLSLGAIWFSLSQLPPLAVAHLRKESILFYQYLLVNARWLVPLVSFSLAGFLAALTIPYLQRELTKRSA
jgi:hypothetical protein